MPASCSSSRTFERVWLLLFLACATSFVFGQSRHGKSSAIEGLVSRLGSKGNQDFQDLQALAANPALSVKVMVADLRTVPSSEKSARADAPSLEHVLWLIRGLRYLTGGIDFCSKNAHVFGTSDEENNRQYWLTFKHGGCVSFFGYWPSHDRIYIAPVDAQADIISQWQHWYSMHGENFDYKPMKNNPPEDWAW